MPDINFTTNGISKLLSKLNPQKANGPMRLLKNYADDVSKFIKIIFQNYFGKSFYDTGDLPQQM